MKGKLPMSQYCIDCKTQNNIVRSGVDAYALEVGMYVGQICYNCATRRIRMQHMTNAEVVRM
jgi:hypothetical protein